MERLFEKQLVKWKQERKPLPLMLVGARQTGKTYSLTKFCKEQFDDNLVLNFIENRDYADFFQTSLKPEDIVEKIELYFNRKIDVEKTVFFFDEIQECEEAISSLKFFADAELPYRIVAAGSLLGVTLNRMKSSFPVGKVQIACLYPMDFEEFLHALDERKLAEAIRCSFASNAPLSGILHEKALMLYRKYLCVGGMPMAVRHFVEQDGDLMKFNSGIASDIITGYLADMVKYADKSSGVKLNQVYRTMPAQLAKPQARFMYNVIAKGGNKEKFQTAVEWLLQANMLLRCCKVEMPAPPLTAYQSEIGFKLYLSDVGLLMSLARLRFGEVMQPASLIYRGFLTENYVAQTFVAHGAMLNYWTSGNLAEIDFIVHLDEGIIPVEVKASDNVRSRSLGVYVEKYHPKYAIRLSSKNFGMDNNIKSVPLYAAHCIF